MSCPRLLRGSTLLIPAPRLDSSAVARLAPGTEPGLDAMRRSDANSFGQRPPNPQLGIPTKGCSASDWDFGRSERRAAPRQRRASKSVILGLSPTALPPAPAWKKRGFLELTD
ncbi:hypothetical protein THAOC_22374 [Thalassiosira oceanica]|uniref:Uncharacterized protein n=1 Tax=Thalassiosira oceanica TaxID=159749 RepID=K0RYM6_THAOC|nr:hypothetical protein THAOC_22374 [Thalassiosira oceanica]|eukprot:EJK57569.1 hypothetical protein THAOC_22374 [Thalassiosira oceanica]